MAKNHDELNAKGNAIKRELNGLYELLFRELIRQTYKSKSKIITETNRLIIQIKDSIINYKR
jgi:flagellin-specific chaperone FliS